MFALLLSLPLLWAQAPGPAAAAAPGVAPAAVAAAQPVPITPETFVTLMRFILWSDPTLTSDDLLGSLLTWLKVMSLLCLVSWVGAWLLTGVKQGIVGRGRWFDYFGAAALILTPVSVMIRVLESVKRMPVYSIASIPVSSLMFLALVICYFVWAEVGLARTIRRYGRGLDTLVFVGIHLGLGLGLAAGLFIQQKGFLPIVMRFMGMPVGPQMTWRDGLVYGGRIGGTYMGYVVLARVAVLLAIELIAVRGRRLYSIARLSLYESNRRMWAPWVGDRRSSCWCWPSRTGSSNRPDPPRMGRLYVGTLSLLCSVLLTVMVTILTPLSLPTDIQQQTIYTVVSKPVRRLELIWGRMIGYMALVTLLVAVFGGISLLLSLARTVGSTDHSETEASRPSRPRKRVA